MQHIKVALADRTKHIQKKPRLRERTARAWFSCLLQHPAQDGLTFWYWLFQVVL